MNSRIYDSGSVQNLRNLELPPGAELVDSLIALFEHAVDLGLQQMAEACEKDDCEAFAQGMRLIHLNAKILGLLALTELCEECDTALRHHEVSEVGPRLMAAFLTILPASLEAVLAEKSA